MHIRSLLAAGLAATLGLTGPAFAQTEDSATATETAPTPDMAGSRYVIDHIFFFSDGFAPELAYTEQHGFHAWPFSNTHTGQGTTGRYIYFDNVYVEYLWVDDADAAEANIPRARSDFNARNTWRNDPSVSPFGIGLRDRREGEPRAFETSTYTAEWMNGGFDLFPAENAGDITEPWVFFLPDAITGNPRDNFSGRGLTRLDHPNGARVVTAVTLVLPRGQDPSRTLRTLEADGLITIEHGDEHRMEIELDHGAQGETADMRERGMPVIFRW
jgi:hypothetical protein